MARKLTYDDLIEEGVDQATAEALLQKQNEPKPKVVWWQFHATQEVAEEVATAFPDLIVEKRYKTRKRKK